MQRVSCGAFVPKVSSLCFAACLAWARGCALLHFSPGAHGDAGGLLIPAGDVTSWLLAAALLVSCMDPSGQILLWFVLHRCFQSSEAGTNASGVSSCSPALRKQDHPVGPRVSWKPPSICVLKITSFKATAFETALFSTSGRKLPNKAHLFFTAPSPQLLNPRRY